MPLYLGRKSCLQVDLAAGPKPNHHRHPKVLKHLAGSVYIVLFKLHFNHLAGA